MTQPDDSLRPRQSPPGTPVFAEPWHAQVLAIADSLVARRMFTAAEWADALGTAIRDSAKSGAPDNEATYYAAALSALETLIASKAPQASTALPDRVDAWRRAYINTPHGQPVELSAADRPHDDDRDHNDHDHHHH